MGSGPSVDTSHKEIVIVGAGYSGAYLAHKLVSGNVGKVTLVDPKEGMFHSIGALRAAVDESFENKLCVPFNSKLAECHIQSKATGLDAKNKTLTLQNGQTVKYTDLVIATGSWSPFPGKLGKEDGPLSNQAILQMYSNLRKEIVSAKKIVLVGGGAVGVELSGEIKTDYPDKQVTLINSRDFVVSDKGKSSFQKSLQSGLRKKKIDVMLNERVSNLGELTLNKTSSNQTVKTESGKEVECDLIILCTGNHVNNDFFKDELGEALNENGALKVDEFLNVVGYNDIYAIGDVTAIPEEKMAFFARMHADTLYANFKGSEKKYVASPDFAMFVPLGRNGGVGQFKGFVVGDFMVKKVKSEKLLAKEMWGDIGMKAPK